MPRNIPFFCSFTRRVLCLCFYTVTVACGLSQIPGSSSFQPEEESPILERWRWRELEALQQMEMICGTEDADSLLWFATREGVISYDGIGTQLFPFPEEIKGTLTLQLFPSKNGKLYAYTTSGLYSLKDNNWKHELDFPDPTFAEGRNFIVRNSYGVEFAAVKRGLYRLDQESPTLITELQAYPTSLSIDAHDQLWVTLNLANIIERHQSDAQGVTTPEQHAIFNPEGDEYWHFSQIVASALSDEIWTIDWRPNNAPMSYSPDSKEWAEQDITQFAGNNALISGARIGPDSILLISKSNMLVNHNGQWSTLDYPEFEIPTNAPYAFLRNNGNLIVGGSGEVVYEIELSEDRWQSFPNLHFQAESTNRSVWYLSSAGEVVQHDTVYNKWIHHNSGVINKPVGLFHSKDDFVWAYGTHDGSPAVSIFDGSNWKLNKHPELINSIGHLSATQLSNGDVLFASASVEPAEGKGGLVRYFKTASGEFRHQHIAPPIVPNRPASIAEGLDGTLWIGGSGLHTTKADFSEPAKPAAQFSRENWIDHVVVDNEGKVWVAMWQKGLYRKDGDTWTRFTPPQEIRENQVGFVLVDKVRPGNIWVATSKGVSRFDGENWFPNSLPGNVRFNRESGTLKQSLDGAIWVNLANRNWYFRADSTTSKSQKPFEGFRTTRYRLDEEPPHLSLRAEVQESVYPSSLYFEWTGSDKWSFTPQSELRYSYRINEEDWTPYSFKTSTTLVNYPAGQHQIQVRGVDMDGNVSTEVVKASFTILPPIWQRSWFIAAIGATALSIVILISLLIKQGIKHFVQIEEFKIQFFTNISHELRTPLTVILGPLESLLNKYSETEDKKVLELACKNARKMLFLIDQLLDFRSAEQGNIKLNLANSDFNECAKEAARLIQPLAADRSQTLSIEISEQPCLAWFDSEKVEKIISNLLSNAIKYTQTGGNILLRVNISSGQDSYTATIQVEDNGAGIPKKKIDSIFELFYRADNSPSNKVRGSGIGLAYTKNLLELCNGTIDVESPITTVDGEEKGTRFTVSIPLPKTPPLSRTELSETSIEDFPDTTETPELPEPEIDETSIKPVVLIVEDDDDIRAFLATELEKDYQLIEAENGATGWTKAVERIPDIILTDVMMPEMDGKDLCRKIKSSESTSHIPVIMLTALKSESHEISGLEAGADDYIAKPIRIDILKKRIHNLLQARERIHEQFKRLNPAIRIAPKNIASNPVDESFLDKAIAQIEQNISDPFFDVESLAGSMGMSRMTLYRKFKAVTGESPSVFIRSIRMSKSAELLQGEQYNISEISDLVGFSEISHFSNSFKKHFKCTPSQYREKVRSSD
ncbi:hybrid sensor histidine kinase/response regulator transcription factor [Pelagicoccus mobilis]|uniref:histidine kinase n=1 Tax=Pelagicoccus mobilis TaxID=415221 RepID=A0A934S610_9BACT|nr:response regulator [Pelagicoccus mobilis]MBK1880029.1 response regulator [Pelagicoccus mobilis]